MAVGSWITEAGAITGKKVDTIQKARSEGGCNLSSQESTIRAILINHYATNQTQGTRLRRRSWDANLSDQGQAIGHERRSSTSNLLVFKKYDATRDVSDVPSATKLSNLSECSWDRDVQSKRCDEGYGALAKEEVGFMLLSWFAQHPREHPWYSSRAVLCPRAEIAHLLEGGAQGSMIFGA
jgi:hypothetical protein